MREEDKNILVIEDNLASRKMMCKILGEIENIHILEAPNSEVAYKFAMECDIDLFIVDIILDTSTSGDVSGIKFIERIRTIEKYKFTPIIITSSLEDPKLHSYIYFHCYRYFEKPYDREEILGIVKEALMYPQPKEERKFLYYKKGGILYSVLIKNIVYIVNSSKNIEIHCTDCILTAPYKSCKTLLNEINSNDFIQCSKNTIVNKYYIAYVDPANRYINLLKDYGTLEIGIRIKKKFMDRLKND